MGSIECWASKAFLQGTLYIYFLLWCFFFSGMDGWGKRFGLARSYGYIYDYIYALLFSL